MVSLYLCHGPDPNRPSHVWAIIFLACIESFILFDAERVGGFLGSWVSGTVQERMCVYPRGHKLWYAVSCASMSRERGMAKIEGRGCFDSSLNVDETKQIMKIEKDKGCKTASQTRSQTTRPNLTPMIDKRLQLSTDNGQQVSPRSARITEPPRRCIGEIAPNSH